MHLRRITLLAIPVVWATLGVWANPATVSGPAVTPDAALKALVDGNARYVSGSSTDSRRDQNRRCETVTGGQHPVAAILSCADSRAPVELLFDQGIGDLFVIRVAGNVADTNEIGTLEYGVGHLGIPLIVVLGHTNCGAVTAVVQKSDVHGNIAGLLSHITPAAEKARAQHPDAKSAALLHSAIRLNVWQSIGDICLKSPEIREAVKAGKVKIVGGVYDLHSGSVEILGAHPHQDELLKGALKPAVRSAATAGHVPAKAGDHSAPASTEHGHAPPAEHAPAHSADPAPAKPAGHDAAGPANHAPSKPADHGSSPARPDAPAGHSPEVHGLIQDAAASPHAAAPTTQPVPAAAASVPDKQTRTLALAGLITGSAVLSFLVVHIVRTHR